jgi:hypothetical protein
MTTSPEAFWRMTFVAFFFFFEFLEPDFVLFEDFVDLAAVALPEAFEDFGDLADFGDFDLELAGFAVLLDFEPFDVEDFALWELLLACAAAGREIAAKAAITAAARALFSITLAGLFGSREGGSTRKRPQSSGLCHDRISYGTGVSRARGSCCRACRS